jgi:pilus assembly protein Flp/PilA
LKAPQSDVKTYTDLRGRIRIRTCWSLPWHSSQGEFMTQYFRRLLNDESGQDLIEYALIAALVSIIAITGLNGLSSKINSEFTRIGNSL